MRGCLITIEGCDGSGKTTGARYLFNLLREYNLPVSITREPGGIDVGERIRAILLDKELTMAARTELLLFWAARVEHYERVVRPRIEQGGIVICDRFIDSTMAYQGYGRGLKQECELMERNFLPKNGIFKTLFFAVDAAEAERRMNLRDEARDRFDDEELAFKQRVRDGFEARFNFGGERMYRIDANQSIDGVRKQLDTFAIVHLIPAYDRHYRPQAEDIRRATKCKPIAVR